MLRRPRWTALVRRDGGVVGRGADARGIAAPSVLQKPPPPTQSLVLAGGGGVGGEVRTAGSEDGSDIGCAFSKLTNFRTPSDPKSTFLGYDPKNNNNNFTHYFK